MLIIPLNSKFLLFIYTSLSFLHIDIVSLFYASEKNMKSSKCTLNIIPYKQNFGGEFNLANCYTIVQLVNIFFYNNCSPNAIDRGIAKYSAHQVFCLYSRIAMLSNSKCYIRDSHQTHAVSVLCDLIIRPPSFSDHVKQVPNIAKVYFITSL